MAMALDYRWKATVSAQKKNIELAKKFRKSNIFNHNLISFPLLNYLPFDQIATRSFLEIQKEPWSDSGVFSLDTQRLFWTPRFIHLDELFIYYFMQSTQNEKKNFNGKSDIEAIWKRYAQLNSVQRFTTESVAKQNSMELLGVNINLVNVSILNDVPSKYYVGLANTTVSEDDALQSLVDPAHKMTIHDKEQLFRMANAAVKEGANFITFPEFFIATVYKGNIIKNLIMDCQSYTKYRPNETTGGIFVSWRRKEELPTGA